MKKLAVLLILCFFLLSHPGFTQQKPFLFGFKIAPNIGWMKPGEKNYQNEGSEINFAWGFNTEFFLMENYAIVTGFNVAYITGNLSYPEKRDAAEGTLFRKYRTQYIEVPFILKMKTRDFKNFRFFGQIGLGTGFLIGARADDTFRVDGQDPVKDDDNNIKEEMKTNRESLILGVGFEYNLGGSTSLTFGVNFNNGFTDVLKDQNTIDPDISHQAINNYLELSIGILF